jgi:hypothetical protein
MPLETTRPVTEGTRRNLIAGLRGRPISAAAVDAALRQAVSFTELLVNTYDRSVANGEVGIGGSATASDAPILADRPPTALLYGRVQSGKTAAMILTSALAFDHGFRVVIVLTADNVALVEQTANRFKALNGPRVFSTVTKGAYEWAGIEDEIAKDVPNEGIVLVCSKNSFQIPQVLTFLTNIEATGFPALVLDDEADAATPDTTLAARTAGRPNAPRFPSTIYSRVVENTRPGQEGESISEILPHSILVQVTATPFVLYLQSSRSRLRPTFTYLLEPGAGYCGGRDFFAAFRPNDQTPDAPLVLVDPNEARLLSRKTIPTGLSASINLFLLAASAKVLQSNGSWPTEGFKHLSHASHKIADHTLLYNHVERYVAGLRRELRDNPDSAVRVFEIARSEFNSNVSSMPADRKFDPQRRRYAAAGGGAEGQLRGRRLNIRASRQFHDRW